MTWRISGAGAASLCLLLLTLPLGAQEREPTEEAQPAADYENAAMMEAWARASTPGEPHARLAQMEGDWDLEIQMWMDPDAPPIVETGTASSRMEFGGRFLVEEVNSSFMGQPFRGLGTHGYNNLTGEYEATWIDDHSTAIHTHRGQMEGNQLVLTGRYPDAVTGEWKETRGVLTFVSPTEMRYASYEVSDDGNERKVMEITYRKRS